MATTEERIQRCGDAYLDDMLNMEDESNIDFGISEVTEFFKGRNVFITGASGFLGKLIIEKLLRLCGEIGKLYIFMRPRKGRSPEERFKAHFNDVLYDKLKQLRPNFMDHLVLIEGDVEACDLGLSPKDRQLLIENVNVFIHGAATVRFNEGLSKIVNANVKGVRSMLMLAKEMKHLQAYVHISTAYSHCTRKHIKEKFYDVPIAVDKIISLAETYDEKTLEQMQPKIIGKNPNTYIFSKALGEEVVRVYGEGIPICIVRPSIILQTWKEPIRGWTDNVYGATGASAGMSACLLRTFLIDGEKVAEVIPADFVVSNIIVAAWDTAKRRGMISPKLSPANSKIVEELEPPIYNCVTSCQNPVKWKDYIGDGIVAGLEVIGSKVLWRFIMFMTKREWLFNFLAIFLHWIPAIIIDTLAMSTGRKPGMFKMYSKVHGFVHVLAFFCLQEWKFDNKNVQELWKRTSLCDRKNFNFNVESLDWHEFAIYHMRGIRVYLFKDPMLNLKQARIRYKKLCIAHFTLTTLIGLFGFWIIISLINQF